MAWGKSRTIKSLRESVLSNLVLKKGVEHKAGIGKFLLAYIKRNAEEIINKQNILSAAPIWLLGKIKPLPFFFFLTLRDQHSLQHANMHTYNSEFLKERANSQHFPSLHDCPAHLFLYSNSSIPSCSKPVLSRDTLYSPCSAIEWALQGL